MNNNKKIVFSATAVFLLLFLAASGASADTAGQRESFFVNSTFDKYKRTKIDATLRHVGDHAYFYVEDAYWNSLDSVKVNSLLQNISDLAESFDNTIYPKETAFWGSEPNPGIDGDPRITILLQELSDNNGGYLDTSNGYTREQISDSNQREMISVSANIAVSYPDLIRQFIAHEFQHLISFNQKDLKYSLLEDTWLNELRSEYSLSLVGYNDNFYGSSLERRANTFINNPYDSLMEWPNSVLDYGITALFAEYLVEQYGTDILTKTLAGNSFGINSLNQYLQSGGYHERFSDIFINWMAAVYLNDRSRNNKFGYIRPGLASVKIRPQQVAYLPYNAQDYSLLQSVKDWQPVWLEFDVGGAVSGDQAKGLRIDFSGKPGDNFSASFLAFYDSSSVGSYSVESGRINIVSGQGNSYVLNSDGKLKKVVILATKTTKVSGFSDNEPSGYFNVRVSPVEKEIAEAGTIKDGVLIKRPNEKEIYVVWGKYKRYLNPGVISLYGHLNPANAIEVAPEIFNSYQTSNYVKYADDEKVYAVWPDGTKHWLNITARQWDDSGRDWGAIFVINDLELNYYKTGESIVR